MINKRVVLILGAGTSAPYGFPLGTALMVKIIDNIKGRGNDSYQLIHLLEAMGIDQKEQDNFANELHGAKQPSIDAFLQERSNEFLELGKTAIAASLIPYENLPNLLRMEYELGAIDQNQRWYEYLLNLLGTYNGFSNNNLSIITFNYDRSLEYFIFHTAKHRFNLKDQDAIELLNAIPITHIYGQLGKLDFLDPRGRAYGQEVTPASVEKCVEEMHLMYENQDESEFATSNEVAYKLIRASETLIFLGFGYHEKNLERLKLHENFHGDEMVAVFYGQKEGEKARNMQLVDHYASKPNQPKGFRLYSETCTALEFLRNTNFLR